MAFIGTQSRQRKLVIPTLSSSVVPATIAVLSVAIFVALTASAVSGPRLAFDPWVGRHIQTLAFPGLTLLLRPVDFLTQAESAIVVWFLVLAAFLAARWWVAALALFVMPVGSALNEVISLTVSRPRPPADELVRVIGETDTFSFPSGHVAGAVLLYGIVFIAADRIRNDAMRRALKALCVGIVLTVGISRVYYGAHWPSDVFAAYALGAAIIATTTLVYRRLDAAVGSLPLVHAAETAHDENVVHAHALTSLVLFEEKTVAKVYAPGLLPRALYWAAFQAEFPYIRNRIALEAARHRRNLASILTQYWYDSPRVARVTGVEPHGDGLALVAERVEGASPTDKRDARSWLRDLRARFEEAGLPTWQIDPRQPRAVDNILQAPDGQYTIVDLESGLVAPIASPRTWLRAAKRSSVPLFDDIFFDITTAYIARETPEMRVRLGQARFAELQRTLIEARRTQEAWHASEPRLWSKALRATMRVLDPQTWIRPGRALCARVAVIVAADSKGASERLMLNGIETWKAEGHITPVQAAALREQAKAPAVASALTHLGAHVAMTIPLRFPLGSMARAGWTLSMRGKAEWDALRGRASARSAREEHTLLVAAVSAIPGFGAAAYMLSKPLRSAPALAMIAFDRSMRKLPAKLYHRLHIAPLMVWHAKVARPASTRCHVADELTTRIASVAGQARLLAAVVAANAVMITIAVATAEPYIINIAAASQFTLAAVAAVTAWRAYWQRERPATEESAGILLWLLMGAGLLFVALDALVPAHQTIGSAFGSVMRVIPLSGHLPAHTLTIVVVGTIASIALVFVDEFRTSRASSMFLLAAVIAAVALTFSSVTGIAAISHTTIALIASAMVLQATIARYVEVRGGLVRRSVREEAKDRMPCATA